MRLRPAAIRAMGRAHRAVYRLSGGRLLRRVAGMPVLMLTTTGRRTGQARTAPLTYFELGEEIAIVASNGGEDSPPRWWLNLQAEPRATIAIAGCSEEVTARAATTAEHDQLWPVITGTFRAYGDYARRTTRPIPVVILTRSTTRSKENAPNR